LSVLHFHPTSRCPAKLPRTKIIADSFDGPGRREAARPLPVPCLLDRARRGNRPFPASDAPLHYPGGGNYPSKRFWVRRFIEDYVLDTGRSG
jgi:hypothetical protein